MKKTERYFAAIIINFEQVTCIALLFLLLPIEFGKSNELK